MLPASRAAWVPVFIATPTSACASAGASFVPSPVIATRRPLGLLLADQRELGLRRRLGEEVVDAGLLGDLRRRQPVVAGDHHRADAHRAQAVEALAHALLDDVLELDHAEHLAVARDGERRRRPRARSRSSSACELGRRLAALRRRPSARIASPAPLRRRVPLRSTPLIRVCAVNGTKRASHAPRARARGCRTAWRARRSSGPPASRRRASAICAASARSASLDARHRHERGRLAVAERDRAGLVEQQHVDVAGRLDRAAGQREHVAAHEAVHAGDADRAQQRADRRRDQRDEQRDQHRDRDRRCRRTRRTAAA